MRIRLNRFFQQFVLRWYWIQQVLVTAIAASIAWQVGDGISKNGGLVAAIVATLTVSSSLHKSTREGIGQVVGSTVGAGAALLALHFFGLGIITVGITVLLSLVAARILHLGSVAAINVPVTALIVIGPGLSETNAVNRLTSTIIGAAIAIVLSAIAYPKSPAHRTIDRISSLSDRCAVLLAQMAEGMVDGHTIDEAGRWLARARLLTEEIPSIKNQVIEARRVIPPCWYRHHGMVEALSALRDHERMSFSDHGSPTGAVDWFRAFREIEIRLMDLAARTQCSVQEHRADAVRTWRANEHD